MSNVIKQTIEQTIEETEQVKERVLTPEQKRAHELDDLRIEIRNRLSYPNAESFILVLLQNPNFEKSLIELNAKIDAVQAVLEERYNFRY